MDVAWITLVTAVFSLIAAAGAAASGLYNKKRIAEIHVVMNSRMSDALTRIEQLGNALQAQGIAIPDDPNLKAGAGDGGRTGHLPWADDTAVDDGPGQRGLGNGTARD